MSFRKLMAESRAKRRARESGAATICSRYPISALVTKRCQSVPPLVWKPELPLWYGHRALVVSRIGNAT